MAEEFGRSVMAESNSKEVEVEDESFTALKAVVEFSYIGKLELSGRPLWPSSRRRTCSRLLRWNEQQ